MQSRRITHVAVAAPFVRAVARATLLVGLALPLMSCAGSSRAGGPPNEAPTAQAAATAITAGATSPAALTTLVFRGPSGVEAKLSVMVEATEADRERGLMNVQTLPEDQGDLFMWRDVSPNQDVFAPFWMKDTLVPLTVAFVSADGRILEEQDMQPQTLVLHVPHQPYRYAIEANLGWFTRHGMPPGSTVDLSAVTGG